MESKKIQIFDVYGKVIFECEKPTIKDAVLEAIKKGADLQGADLRYADLQSANLQSADLRSANLQSADLRYANLQSANLRYADLQSADLRYADLQSANLRYADLRYADLRSANLQSADLQSAKNAELVIAMTRILPDGDIIGWKKCKNNVIVKLLIPADAKRSHAFGRKCRAEFAKVVEILGDTKAVSQYDSKFTYEVGKIVKPKEPFSEDWISECESGIHFFITRLEAENY